MFILPKKEYHHWRPSLKLKILHTMSCKCSKIKPLTKSVLFFIFSLFCFLLQKTAWRYKYEILFPLGVLWIKAGQFKRMSMIKQQQQICSEVFQDQIFWSILTLWEASTQWMKTETSLMNEAKRTSISQWWEKLGFQSRIVLLIVLQTENYSLI